MRWTQVPYSVTPDYAQIIFDLLRVLFAGAVCLVHSYELSGFHELEPLVKWISSAVAVKAFFVLSGFLIFMSYERSNSLTSYAGKRVRRIYPAYFVIIALCAVGLAAVSTLPISEYFSIGWRKYVLYNLVFLNSLHPTLPGVFDSNPISLVNGSLWTIRIEAMFYCCVPCLALLFRRVSHLSVLALVYCLSVAGDALIALLVSRIGASIYLEFARELLVQLRYFMAGAALFYFLPAFERRVTWFVTFAVLLLIVNLRFSVPLLEPLALAVIVVFFGLYLFAGNFSKYGDFSYGIYIVHFPIIQLAIQSGWPRQSPRLFLGAIVGATILGSIAMWHLVEKRFLLRSSHYVLGQSPQPRASP